MTPVPSPMPLPARLRRWLLRILPILALFVLFVAAHSHKSPVVSAAGSRTAVVKRGDFVRSIRISGSTEAVRAFSVQSPQMAGGGNQMVLMSIVKAGTRVHQGDVLAEFDPQAQLKQFRDSQADYLGFLDKIKKQQADNATELAKDQTALKAAEDDYAKAKLEMAKNEIVSHIDAENNRLTLEQSEATLKQLKQTFDLKEQARQSQVKDLEVQRDKAHDQMVYAQQNSQRLTIHSPLDGLVVLNPIWKGSGMGDPQEGDQVWPGSPFMQVVDPASMQVSARVNQVDFPYLHIGQPVEVRLDAYSDLVLEGSIQNLAAIGTVSTLSQSVHNFNAVFSIRGSDPRLLPDLSASVDVELERVPGALLAPRDAFVTEGGKTYAWVKNGTGFEKRTVILGKNNDVEAVVTSGLAEGDMIKRNPEETLPGG